MTEGFRIEPLGAQHSRRGFDCGDPALTLYLGRQAREDVRRGIAQVFVLSPEADRSQVAGYYALSGGFFDRDNLPLQTAQRLPRYPVPTALLDRLAVDSSHQGKGLGEQLLLDALARINQAKHTMAVYAVVASAGNEAAALFYRHYGFRAFPTDPLRLFLHLDTAAQAGL